MLDVAIGIIFIYLLLSLICSAINEIVEAYLKLRAVDLEQGIRELLNDYSGTNLVQKIYDHPLVYSLFRGDYNPGNIRVNSTQPQKNRYSRGSELPSYIPARNFALALMDVILPAQMPAPGLPAVSSGSTGAMAPQNASLPIPNSNGPEIPAANPNPLQPLRDAVGNIANTRVQQSLLTLIDAAGDDAGKARENIENWYNSSMDRVSGWYKRRVQKIVFCLGFAIAIIMNVDSFAILNNLANDRPLRNSIVAAAQNMQDVQKDTTKQSIKQNINTLLEFGLPIGWGWKSEINNNASYSNLDAIPESNDIGLWLLKVIGWIVTGLAVSLGAPFWFDILNKVMVIRSTVKPAEKSPEEGSEDRPRKS